MNKASNWTIRTRNITSGNYHEASYFGMTEQAAGSIALADHPNSEVVGVWPWARTAASASIIFDGIAW
jgi:hypothetical protein